MIAEIDTTSKIIRLKSRTSLSELSKFVEEFNLQGYSIEGWYSSYVPETPVWPQYPTYGTDKTNSPCTPPWTITCADDLHVRGNITCEGDVKSWTLPPIKNVT